MTTVDPAARADTVAMLVVDLRPNALDRLVAVLEQERGEGGLEQRREHVAVAAQVVRLRLR